MRLESNIDGLWLPLVPTQFHLVIIKPSKVLNRVQKGLKLELNSWSPFRLVCGWRKLRLNRTLGDQLLRYPPASSFLIFRLLLNRLC